MGEVRRGVPGLVMTLTVLLLQSRKLCIFPAIHWTQPARLTSLNPHA